MTEPNLVIQETPNEVTWRVSPQVFNDLHTIIAKHGMDPNIDPELEMALRGEIRPRGPDAAAAQAREILRTVKVQLQISGQTNRPVPVEVIEFSEGKAKREIKK